MNHNLPLSSGPSLRSAATSFGGALSVMIFFVFVPFLAQGDGGKLCVGSQPVQLRSGIAGSLKAQLLPGACVISTGEEREGWTRVTVDGWIDNASVAARPQGTQPAPIAAAGALSLVGSQVVEGARDLMGVPTQVQVVLVIQNSSPNPISSWSGILAAKDSKGQFPIRMRVSGSKAVPAGAKVEERFNWGKGDPEFSLLLSPEGKGLEFSLNQIVAK